MPRVQSTGRFQQLQRARTKPPGDTNPESEGVPPSSPPQRERRPELPLLLRVPPPSYTATSAMSHVPAAVVSAAAAALRQAQPSTSRIRSFIPTGRSYPVTTIRTSLTRPPTPRPSESHRGQGDHVASFTVTAARGGESSHSAAPAIACARFV